MEEPALWSREGAAAGLDPVDNVRVFHLGCVSRFEDGQGRGDTNGPSVCYGRERPLQLVEATWITDTPATGTAARNETCLPKINPCFPT